jgi:hypothetical protein
MYSPEVIMEKSSNVTVSVIGSLDDETVVDCECDFETNCNNGNATRAFIMDLKGIVSVSDLTVRNCGGSPLVEEAKLLKTPLHELPLPRDVWDGVSSDNSNTRRSRLGGGILIEVRKMRERKFEPSDFPNTPPPTRSPSREDIREIEALANAALLECDEYSLSK